MKMNYLEGKNQIGEIVEKFPKVKEVLLDLGISQFKEKDKLVELALANKIPLQILLNNISKQIGIPVKWPKVNGMKNDFSASTGLRSGRPAGIKKVIAVHSGKGGVGKTMIATSLAIYLSEQGYKCGLLDLDLDCPNVYKSLELTGKALANAAKKIVPLQYNQLKVLSMGAIQDRDNQAIMWRGPILAKAIDQLLYDTEWGDLDLLIVDLPPGTGDSPLTIFNMLKPEGLVIVTTPHPTALLDAEKSVDMCRSLGVGIIGVIGNMAGEIFGHLKKDWLKKIDLKQLGEIALDKKFAQHGFWKKGWPSEMLDCYKLLQKLILG